MEILFKAKRADEKGWVIFNSFLTTKFSGAIFTTNSPIIYDGKFPIIFDIEVIPETVCQFIDNRKGVDFWQSDKVKHNDLRFGVIKWANTGYVIQYEDNYCIDLHEDWDEIEIIGNIYDDGK